jgi:hypothetical protein
MESSVLPHPPTRHLRRRLEATVANIFAAAAAATIMGRDRFPSPADLLYLAGYPLIAAGPTVIPGGDLVLAGGLFGKPGIRPAGDGQSQSGAGGAESVDRSAEVRVRCSSVMPTPSSVTASEARLC